MEPPPLRILLLLVAADLEEELGSLGGHEVGVAVGQVALVVEVIPRL